MRHIVLDSTPLGLLTGPPRSAQVLAANAWAADLISNGDRIYIPEIIDYEIRRELIRAGKSYSVRNLNALKSHMQVLPITTDAMLLAAELWARSRNRGRPTGDPKKLDIDVILAAQALTMGIPESDLIIATTNVGHLTQFAPAALWHEIAI